MNAIIVSGTSDIGLNLIKSLNSLGYKVYATYNKTKPDFSILQESNWLKFKAEEYESEKFKNWLLNIGEWDLFVSCVGTQKPIGLVTQIKPSDWARSVSDNCINQVATFITLLPFRRKKSISSALFFAGGGTNSTTPAYSAYTLGKVSLIKAVELLDDELNDVKVSIIGPGWVETKIHSSTLLAKDKAGKNYEKTIHMLENLHKMNPMKKVIKDILKIISYPKELVGGRNFSSVYDDLELNNLKRLKEKSDDFYKLRRFMNNN